MLKKALLSKCFSEAAAAPRRHAADVAGSAHGEQDQGRLAVARSAVHGLRQGLGCVDLEPRGPGRCSETALMAV